MKNKFILLFAGLTLSLYALPDYTVYHTLPKENKNTAEEIVQIKTKIKDCSNNIYEHQNHQSCSDMRKKMYRDNPLLRSGSKNRLTIK